MADGSKRSGDLITRWVGFELAGQHYGIPILQVQEVLAGAEIEAVPGTGAEVLGVINLRGAIITVLDLRTHLHLPPRAPDALTRIIVVESQGETVGLRVDHVTQVRAIAEGAIKPAPNTGTDIASKHVTGVFSRNGEFITLLDVAALL